MEWVETTGKTVDEAKSQALDQLGVAEDDAEIVVLDEPRPGLFGRVRGEARVRARVRPTTPRPKLDRRDRKKKDSKDSKGSPDRDDEVDAPDVPGAIEGVLGTAESAATAPRARGRRGGTGRSRGAAPAATPDAPTTGDRSPDDEFAAAFAEAGSERTASAGVAPGPTGRGTRAAGGRSRSRADASVASDASDTTTAGGPPARVRTRSNTQTPVDGTGDKEDMVDAAQVGEEARTFVQGVVDAFGLDGTASVAQDGDDLEVAVDGTDLGLLVGPRGSTLQALQELTRVAAQRRLGDHDTRLRVDVGGYRIRRREALTKFAHQVADQVVAEGVAKRLEPMSSADRKVIHDVLSEFDGVETRSEGDDPRRCVVIAPTSA
jgi:spoIIIJ-associated protein